MAKKRIYLDTSVISALYDERTPERQNLTQEAWVKIEECMVFISDVVINELEAAPEELRSHFLSLVVNFTLLKVNDEAEALAQDYVNHNIINEKYFDDALHVAIASVNSVQYLLSWNYKHLVNKIDDGNLLAAESTTEIVTATHSIKEKSNNTALQYQVLPDVLKHGLALVICGTAVGNRSAGVKAYYAGRGNKFWKVLCDVALTPVKLESEQYKQLLQYDYGLTDLSKYASGNDKQLIRG